MLTATYYVVSDDPEWMVVIYIITYHLFFRQRRNDASFDRNLAKIWIALKDSVVRY